MIRNYLIVAIRNLNRQKVYSAINVAGLAIGMACCILIVLFVLDEFSYDRHHRYADRIYRVLRSTEMPGSPASCSPGISGPVGPALKHDFPEVEETARALVRPMWISYESKGFSEWACLGDASLLKIFTVPLVEGDAEAGLDTPHSAFITQRLARKLFGDDDAVGKTVRLKHKWVDADYTITGIMQDLPRNASSLLRFEFLTSTRPRTGLMHTIWERWRPQSSFRPLYTYALLKEGCSAEGLERKLPDFMARYMEETVCAHNAYHLQPITRLHLYSRADYGYTDTGGGDILYVYVFSSIALFVLLLACINFSNLALARSTFRAREIGMRKVVGARRMHLVLQFLGESMFLSMLSMLVALGLVEVSLPTVNGFFVRELSLDVIAHKSLLLALIGISLFTGLLAGSYPAFYLSAFQPVNVLKGTLTTRVKGNWIRKALVVFQFAVSIALIAGTGVVYRQGAYIRNRDLGFNKAHVVVLPLFMIHRPLEGNVEAIKQELMQHPNILKVSASGLPPGWGNWSDRGIFLSKGDSENERQMFTLAVDEDFLETYDVALAAGRNFSKDIASDRYAYILNETAAKQLGGERPLDRTLDWPVMDRKDGPVIGVVRDFHNWSLREPIHPLVLYVHSRATHRFNYLSVRIGAEHIPDTMAFLEAKWRQYIPNRLFEFQFLDESLDALYRETLQQSKLYALAALLTVLVACLGLFGLASLAIQQRTREVMIRKTLGASIPGILLLLSREFLKLVLAANLLAWPVAYVVMRAWLQSFAYRTGIGAAPFLLGGGLALVIALATVNIQALRAATANPADALRHE